MQVLINSLIVVGAFFLTEFLAWSVHKYVMHGFLWYLHKDHHQKKAGFFEKNDTFFLIFAVPSWLCMMYGVMGGCDYRLYIGIGIAIYGLAYFLVHEILIHQRFKWWTRTESIYFKGLRKAHKVHHKSMGKEHGECFGMLVVPFRYFMQARKSKDQMDIVSGA